MHQDAPAWVEHQRIRWMRPDAHRWIRPDEHTFMPPDAPRWSGKDAVRYFWPSVASNQPAKAPERKYDLNLSIARASLLRLRREVVTLKFALKFRKLLCEGKAGFNPDQPRDDHGRWTDGGGEAGTQVAQAGGTVTDIDGTPYYKPGGHHEMPRGVFGKWDLPPETRKVFEDATTGKVPQMLLRTTPDGVPEGHFWNGPNGAHRQDNDAVQELADRFFARNGIRPENMTPDQARDFLREIRESQNSRIRNYNTTIRLLRRLFPLRTGRGNQ